MPQALQVQRFLDDLETRTAQPEPLVWVLRQVGVFIVTGKLSIVNACPAKKAVVVLPWIRWPSVDPFCPPKNTMMTNDLGIQVADLFETRNPRLR